MQKNVVIGVLAVALLVTGGLLVKERLALLSAKAVLAAKINMPPAGPNARGTGRPIMLGKGTNLTKTPLFKFAYEIAPTASADAQKALTGWTVTSQKQSDGSMVVSLTPKDSEDQSQQYTLTSGQTLYFIEQTPFDDKADTDTDLNYRDDYGIIVDQNGIIQ